MTKIKTKVQNPRTPPGTPPAGYRFLVEGEKIRKNDGYFDSIKVVTSHTAAGCFVGQYETDFPKTVNGFHHPWVRKVFTPTYRVLLDHEYPKRGDEFTFNHSSGVCEGTVENDYSHTVLHHNSTVVRHKVTFRRKITAPVATPPATAPAPSPSRVCPPGYRFLSVGEIIVAGDQFSSNLCRELVPVSWSRGMSVGATDYGSFVRPLPVAPIPAVVAPDVPAGYRVLRDDEVPLDGDKVWDSSVCPSWRLVSQKLDATFASLKLRWPGVVYIRKVVVVPALKIPARPCKPGYRWLAVGEVILATDVLIGKADSKPGQASGIFTGDQVEDGDVKGGYNFARAVPVAKLVAPVVRPGIRFDHTTSRGGHLTVMTVEGILADKRFTGVRIAARPCNGPADTQYINLTEEAARMLQSDLNSILK